ncbi:cell division protein FtsL [Lactobacillus ultunensis]|uniref:Cell division protein FtsL n=1 Tax=Lactobacillus ultunensis DSM 16047 TaxID=525365 RepID=C2EMF9_9LACO|nr:cell division protein FtsL [Lactobacillus ultunensis]EEJ72168.1 cell division protein FtsL [Lactobacillus ultunensis DSM 16047]KRL82984.1 cell division protein [Lactobacillus ultunensis DSM 16047]
MANSSARKIEYEYEPSQQNGSRKQQRLIFDPRNIPYNILEKMLIIVGGIITLAMMIFLVSFSISATSAQHQLTKTQQSVIKEQSKVTELRQEIGELTSTTRLNKIAREKGLTLINKNIRTIR